MALFPILFRGEASRWKAPSWALTAGFPLIVLFALFFDSRFVLDSGFNGQILSNLVVPLYLLWMYRHIRPEHRLTVALFVPVSAIAEIIFSPVIQLYDYKFNAVPPYVPFGHAILFATGLLISESPLVLRHERNIRRVLIALYVALFGVTFILQDSLGLIFWLLFAVIFYRKRGQVFYLIMGILVLYVEILGTTLGCWTWDATPLSVLRTTNPPISAFVLYMIGDILVMKIARRVRGFNLPYRTVLEQKLQ
jgi:hypothetical protein